MLITLGENDTITMWNIQESTPYVQHSLRFKREKISHLYSPFDSKESELIVIRPISHIIWSISYLYGHHNIWSIILIQGLIEHGKSPFKWLYIGTERGNVHLVNYENFLLNDYVINWNKGKSIIEVQSPQTGTERRPQTGPRSPGYSTEPWFKEFMPDLSYRVILPIPSGKNCRNWWMSDRFNTFINRIWDWNLYFMESNE